MKRLLDYVRERKVRGRLGRLVTEFADIALELEASPAVMTNWKARGISLEGALKAQKRFGCDANWLLSGEGAAEPSPWPFTREVLNACAQADPGLARRAENAARAVLGLEGLPSETAWAA